MMSKLKPSLLHFCNPTAGKSGHATKIVILATIEMCNLDRCGASTSSSFVQLQCRPLSHYYIFCRDQRALNSSP